MKTKVLLFALLSGFIFSASAQEYKPQIGFSTENGSKTNFKKNKAGDNWFITLGGGASIFIGDQNKEADFVNRLNILPQVSFGKWYNPYLGGRIQLQGGSPHGFVGDNAEVMQHKKFFNAHADLLWDITNFWAPYNEAKVFRFIPFVGLGYAVNSGKVSGGVDYRRSESPSINFGAIAAFRLSKRIDLNLEAQGALLGEHFNRIDMGHEEDGFAAVTLGLNFKLGKTDFEVLQPMDYDLLNDLNSKINALRSENEELGKRPESCPECPPAAAAIVENNYIENVVYFRLNSAKIDKNQEINIFNTSEFVKKNSTPIKVVGYADKKTGTSDYNLKLSERRARAVAKELIEKYGISSNQITIEWKGSDVQPYAENNWNRVVVMSANE